jgi:hypothetical protein
MDEECPDCGVPVGRRHALDCEEARCDTCGWHYGMCDCEAPTDVWTGLEDAESLRACVERGLWVRDILVLSRPEGQAQFAMQPHYGAGRGCGVRVHSQTYKCALLQTTGELPLPGGERVVWYADELGKSVRLLLWDEYDLLLQTDYTVEMLPAVPCRRWDFGARPDLTRGNRYALWRLERMIALGRPGASTIEIADAPSAETGDAKVA